MTSAQGIDDLSPAVKIEDSVSLGAEWGKSVGGLGGREAAYGKTLRMVS